jgi:hypothetical protein
MPAMEGKPDGQRMRPEPALLTLSGPQLRRSFNLRRKQSTMLVSLP